MVRCRQSLVPMQGRTASNSPARVLETNLDSANIARASPTTSAFPSATTAAAACGVETRPV